MTATESSARRVAVLFPRGFGDLLRLARQNRRELYASMPMLDMPWEAPGSPAPVCFEVAGRIDAAGNEAEPLDEAEVGRLAARLVASGVDAVAICGLFSPLNPTHEKRLGEWLSACWPGHPIVLSHAVMPQASEVERFAATVRLAQGFSPEPPLPSPEPAPADAEEALARALRDLTDRMQRELMHSARSSIAREAGDCAAALFLPDGRLLAQARWLPLLLGSLIDAVQAVLAKFPAAAMAEGDGFLLNDPWEGGSHLPDLTLVVPIVVPMLKRGDQVIALAALSLHHQDVGGITPGSVPPNATSIFEEGLRVPVVHSHRRGRLDATLRSLLLANTRTPAHLEADLQAQWASAALGARELRAICERQGSIAAFGARAHALLARTEAQTRASLAAAQDGRYEWQDQLDCDGVDDRPVPLRVAIDKRGDALTIDFTGSAAQTRGPANASPASMRSAALYFMRTLAPDAPDNGGCLAPLTLVLPEGSVVNPRWPAAVNARTATVKLAANALLGAWGSGAAALTSAAHAGVAVVLSLGGEDDQGRPFAFTEIIASGAGASALGAGASAVSTDVGNARNTPVEVIERDAPVRIEAYELRRGSGGAGRHRGGDGVRRACLLLHGQAQLSYRGERHLVGARGCAGGAAGATSVARILRADGRIEMLGARARVALQAGDRWIIETAGGGGWGALQGDADADDAHDARAN